MLSNNYFNEAPTPSSESAKKSKMKTGVRYRKCYNNENNENYSTTSLTKHYVMHARERFSGMKIQDSQWRILEETHVTSTFDEPRIDDTTMTRMHSVNPPIDKLKTKVQCSGNY